MISRLKRCLKKIPGVEHIVILVRLLALQPINYGLMRARIAVMSLIQRCGLKNTNDRRLMQLKDMRAGKACVIVGNGPSLRLDDLEKFRAVKIECFGLNRICDLFDKTLWRPDYICVMDTGFLTGMQATMSPREYVETMRKNGVKEQFLIHTLKKRVRALAGADTLFFRAALLPHQWTNIQSFSEHIELYMSDMGTVTGIAIQLACYMGFRKIYLYGQDFNYKRYIDMDGKLIKHEEFDEYAAGIRLIKKSEGLVNDEFCAHRYADVRKATLGMEKCLEFCTEHNVEIYNITRGGQLEVFERLEFERVIK